MHYFIERSFPCGCAFAANSSFIDSSLFFLSHLHVVCLFSQQVVFYLVAPIVAIFANSLCPIYIENEPTMLFVIFLVIFKLVAMRSLGKKSM